MAPIIIAKIISSLSHCAHHCNGQLYGCLSFLQAWLSGHISLLPSSTPLQVASIPAPSRNKALIDYQGLLANLSAEHIIWRAKWYKAHYLHLFSENRTYIILTRLYQSTPYVPIRVLRQFTLNQDLFNFATVYGDIYKLDYKTPHPV